MDTSKFESNSVTFNFGQDVSRDLLVAVQSWYSTETNGRQATFLSEGVLTYIDSTVPWIVMPDEACDEIEQSFGLSMDNTTGLYLLSESQHTTLSSRNPNFTFVLGNSLTGGATVSISLPYKAFDLSVSAPYVNSTSKYFPLKRGNDSTYTLGRTFLQEAYVLRPKSPSDCVAEMLQLSHSRLRTRQLFNFSMHLERERTAKRAIHTLHQLHGSSKRQRSWSKLNIN